MAGHYSFNSWKICGMTSRVYAVFHTSRDPEKWRRRLP